MIFSIRNLGFELGSLLLEGWAAFAARVVCATAHPCSVHLCRSCQPAVGDFRREQISAHSL